MPWTRFSALRQASSRNSTGMPLSIRSSRVPFDLAPLTVLLGVAIWLAATALTVAVATVIVVRLPATYFSEDAATHAARLSPWRSPRALAQNALGIVLIAVGLVMSVPGIPGQGLLTVLIGLMLVDFPGRRRIERALARRRGLLAAMNRIRARFGHAPLLPPPDCLS